MAEKLFQRIVPQPRLKVYAQQLDFISHCRKVVPLLLELTLELLAGVLGGTGCRQRHPQVFPATDKKRAELVADNSWAFSSCLADTCWRRYPCTFSRSRSYPGRTEYANTCAWLSMALPICSPMKPITSASSFF